MSRPGSLFFSLTLLHFVGNCNGALAAQPKPTTTQNPFAYCSHVGTADVPVGGSSPVPLALQPYLARVLGLPVKPEITPQNYYWRCMDGAVYVCAIGANLPCYSKANQTKRNQGAENYCQENREAPLVPAYATGHDTVYEWGCSRGRAVRGKRTATLDRRGYRIVIWHKVLRDSEP